MAMTLAIGLAVVVVLVVAFLGYAASRPDTFRVQRSKTIAAPAEKIFALINDHQGWATWSPYEKLDPAMRRTYSGAANGKGAVYEWAGNAKVGKGRMEIMEAAPPGKISIKLDFSEPFVAHNTAEFTLEPQGGSTNVTWAMHGPCPFMMKVIHLFMNMDRMVGKRFEEGLANLKVIAEK